jgi:hypothetical protein
LSVLATVVIRDVTATLRSQRFASDAPPAPETASLKGAEPPRRRDAPEESVRPAAVSQAGAPLPLEELPREEPEEEDPSILQWMTRRQLADGVEAVEGSVRIHFAIGERSAVAHVSFIPPLSDRPSAECQVLDEFNGRVRIGVAQAYGLRIEARRSESVSHPLAVDVGFSAQVRAAQSAAA